MYDFLKLILSKVLLQLYLDSVLIYLVYQLLSLTTYTVNTGYFCTQKNFLSKKYPFFLKQ